jgi:Ras-related GTP-binding protein C/D
VVQKIIPQVQNIQFLLDQMNVNCKIEKSYLFEIVSKLYLASDSSPIDLANFQLCSEMIDVFIDISFIYGNQHQNFQDNNTNKSSAIIKLSDGTILLFKEVEKYNKIVH